MLDNSQETFLAIEGDSIYKVEERRTLTRLGSLADELSALSKDSAVTIPNLLLFGGIPVGVSLSARMARFFVSLPTLNLSTQWRVTDEKPPVFIPAFGGGSGSTAMSRKWKVPQRNFKLHLVVLFTRAATYEPWSMNSADGVYLIATLAGKPGTFKPPLPNVFDDGRVCMGSSFAGENGIRGVLSESFERAVNTFYSSPWNGDLLDKIPNRDACHRSLFAFDTDDKQLPPGEANTYVNSFIPCSNARYADLPLGVS